MPLITTTESVNMVPTTTPTATVSRTVPATRTYAPYSRIMYRDITDGPGNVRLILYMLAPCAVWCNIVVTLVISPLPSDLGCLAGNFRSFSKLDAERPKSHGSL